MADVERFSQSHRPPTSPYALEARNLSVALSDRVLFSKVNLVVAPGQKVAIVGRSGEGKSTLLHALAGLLEPQEGQVFINGTPLEGLSPRQKARLRIDSLGFVMQFSELIPELSLLENVMVPGLLAGDKKSQLAHHATDCLASVELTGAVIHRKPSEVSGGQLQRAAIARALSRRPSIIFADEPTGALDHATSQTVLNLLIEQVELFHTALVVVTHDREIVDQMDCTYQLDRGALCPTHSTAK